MSENEILNNPEINMATWTNQEIKELIEPNRWADCGAGKYIIALGKEILILRTYILKDLK